MWQYTDWTKRTKIITSCLVGFMVITALLSGDSTQLNTSPSASQASVTAPSGAKNEVSTETANEPIKQYEKIDTYIAQGVRAYTHYQFLGITKPTKEETQQYMLEIEKRGCGEPKICNYFLWDTKEAYEAGKDSVSNASNAKTVAEANKEHLVGYLNSGFAFYFYGSTGDGSGNVTILDADAGKYMEF